MTPNPSRMSPESQTVRRDSNPGHTRQGGGRPSGGSPRHGKNRGHNNGQPRSSPKSQYYQQQTKASTPPARRPSFTPTSREDSIGNNNGSPTAGLGIFAGSKFSEAPSPDLLPRPPAHWLSHTNGLSTNTAAGSGIGNVINENMTRNLKFMLKVPVQS